MTRQNGNHFRGFLQSDDGVITRVIEKNTRSVRFEAGFTLSDELAERVRNQPGNIVFTERSRIARLGVNITGEMPGPDVLDGNTVVLGMKATPVISGYPGLSQLAEFFTDGLPVGRLVYCDPDALLTAGEVLAAVETADMKLPESTTITSDGTIVISPHRVICRMREPVDRVTLGRILLKDDGREMLNRYQVSIPVAAVTIPPGQGVVTTCSMYLNDHYVVLQSGFETGSHLAATVLDPIKTRGIRIYLEIVNGSNQPIVNPLITAKVYRAPKSGTVEAMVSTDVNTRPRFTYDEMKRLEATVGGHGATNCHYMPRPMALIPQGGEITDAGVFVNGPDEACSVPLATCVTARRDHSRHTRCAHAYATAKIRDAAPGGRATVVARYFPNMLEHRDLVNMAYHGKLGALYFYKPSSEQGPYLSQRDHNRLEEYNAFGVKVCWVSELTRGLMVHTLRDGKGYFVAPDRLADFHKSMLFAFYGSNIQLSENGAQRLAALMNALVRFWGKNIGIVTGGGSGVMEQANTLARERGILSGANFLDITDQSLTTDVDFCQIFQSTCRHSRQKWFEIASFPIFNVGGIGTLEELGITLCNMKLSILESVPIILFDTEGDGAYWRNMEAQIKHMVRANRAPGWIADNIVITSSPEEVIAAYHDRLNLF
ncbi:MAG: LOG family protein [Desulfatibacillaceae bacterium]